MVLSKGEITITEIFDGEVGQSAVIAVLDNDSHVIPTDTEGTPGAGAFDGASTTLSIFEGTTDVTADGWDITVQKSTGVDGTWDATSFTFTAHTLTEDNGSVRFTCTKAGFPNVYKTFTLTKSKQGAVGENAVQAFLAKDNSYFKRDVLNETIIPASVEFQSLQKEGAGGETPLAAYFVVYEQAVEAYKVNDYLELVVQDELEGDKEYIISDKEFPYVERYRSTGPETTLNYTVGSNSVGLKVEVYRDPEFTQLIDHEQLPVLIDGMTTYQHVRFADDEYGAGFDTNPEGKKYMGTMNSHYATGSSEPTDYAWVLFKGDDSYVFFKYSNDGGKTFTAKNGETPGDYMGVYKTDINEASPNVGDYIWYKTKGEKGQDGISVDKVNVKYYRSNSQTTLEGGRWLDNPPAWEDGTYIWSKTVTTYTNQNPTETDPVCITGGKGTDGKGIVEIEEQYARHTSKDSAPAGSAFGSTRPTWEPGTYIWTRTVITYTDNEVVPTTPVVDASWEAIDAIKLGGRNFVKNSNELITITRNYYGQEMYVTTKEFENQTVTVSFDARSIQGDGQSKTMRVYWRGGSATLYMPNVTVTEEWARYTVSHYITSQNANSGNNQIAFHLSAADTFVGEIKNIKVERGNKASDWSPAPEDVEAAYTAVAEAKADLARIEAEAHADGIVEAEEARAIQEAKDNLEAAKADATEKANAAETAAINAAKADATTKANDAKDAAITAANAKAEAERVIAEAYADGIVSDEEQARINDVNAKLDLAKADAKNKADAAQLAAEQYAKAQADAIEVGGRNLLRNTSSEYADASHSIYYARIHAANLEDIGLKAGDVITYSVYVKAHPDFGERLRIRWHSEAGSSTNHANDYGDQEVSAGNEGRLSLTATIPENTDNFFLCLSGVPTGTNFTSEFKELQLEKGNKATDWTPAPEDVDANIKSVKDSVDTLEDTTLPALEDGLLNKSEKEAVRQALKVVESDKKGVDAQYTSVYNNSSLSGTPKTNLRTAKNDYNTAYNNLESAVTAVLNVADSTRITQSQIDNVENKFSAYGSALATIRQRFEETLDAISGKKIDDVEVGGRNLLLGTSNELEYNLVLDNLDIVPNMESNEKYTISFKARTSNGTDRMYMSTTTVSPGSTFQRIVDHMTVPDEYTKYSFTFTAQEGSEDVKTLMINNRTSNHPNNTGVLYIKEIKLEKGNKATDWTPAPEDVEHQQNLKTYIPVRYIRDWSAGSTFNTGNHKYEIKAYANGDNVALGKPVSSDGPSQASLSALTDGNTSGTYASAGNSSTPVYMEIDLGQIYYNVDSVGVWRYHSDGRTYHQTKTEVSADGSTWYPIFDSFVEGEYPENSAGKTFANTWAKYEATQVSKSGLQIANESIGLRVQKNRVIAAINASVNGDESNVKISADRVDIEGKVTFSSLDSTAQSKINAIEANASSAKGTLDSKAKIWDGKATPGDISTAIDNVEVGGRNLLTGTSEKEREATSSSSSIGSWNPSLTIGEEYTFSFDIRSENATYLRNVFLNSSNNGFAPNTPVSKEWTRVHFTFEWKGGTYSGNEFAPHIYPRPDYSGTYVSRIKLEKGNKATDWTPAPEDVPTKNELATAGQTIINGDNITTGTIDADYIDVTSLVAKQAVIDKITSTEIKADKIKGGILSAINGPTTLNLNDGTFNIGNKLEYNGSTLTLNVDELQIRGNSGATQSDVSTAIDNVEVGGRNYLSKLSLQNGYFDLKILEVGDTYTFSSEEELWRVKISPSPGSAGSESIVFTGPTKQFTFILTEEMKNLGKLHFVKNSSASRYTYDELVSMQAKLEKGNKATDWTPAPEDVDESINQVAGDLSAVESRVSTAEQKITDNAIVSTVSSSTKFKDVESKASSAKSTLDSKASEWDGKATEYKVNYSFTSSPDYVILLCRSNVSGSRNHAIGTLIGRRNSGHYNSGKVDIVFNNNTSGTTPTGYIEATDMQNTNSWSMVTCDYDGVNYIALRHNTGNTYGLWDTGSTFTGQISSSGEMLLPVQIADVSNVKDFDTSKVSSPTTRLDQRLKSAELKITDNAIVSTVTSSTTFTDVKSKADSAKSTLDSKASTWDSKPDTSYVDGKASTAETNAKSHAEKIAHVQQIDGTTKKFINLGGMDSRSSSINGYLVIKTPITSSYMTRVKISGYNYLSNNTNIDLVVGFYAHSTNILQHSYLSSGDFAIDRVRLARDSNGRAVIIIGHSNTNWKYPRVSIDEATIGYQTPPDSYKDGWSTEITTDISAYDIQVSNVGGGDVNLKIDNAQDTANTANSTANTLRDTTIPQLTSRVSTAEQKITDNAIVSTVTSSSTFTSVKNNADSAKSTLDSKSKDWDSKATPSDIDSKILSDKKIPDRRDTNELPSWYRSNYPQQIVTEFKRNSALGVGTTTYGTLTTKVSWSNNSGDKISQQYENDGEIFYRTGNSSDTAWGNWKTAEDTLSSSEKAKEAEERALKRSAHFIANTASVDGASNHAGGQGLRITVTEDIHINSAVVYSDSNQTISVHIKNAHGGGSNVWSSSIPVVTGENRIPIGYVLEKSVGKYSLYATAPNNLRRTPSAGVDFPYDSGSFVISESYTSNGYYYYFYDIEISGIGVDGRVLSAERELKSITERVSTAEQKITDSAIVSTVTQSSTYTNAMGKLVEKDKIASTINQTAQGVTIDAQKINLQGAVTISSFNSSLKSDYDSVKSTASTAKSTANTANSKANAIEGKINNAVTTIDGTGVTVKDGSFFLEDDATNVKYSIVSTSNLVNDHSFELTPLETTSNAYGERYIKSNPDAYGAWATLGSPLMFTALNSGTFFSSGLFGKNAAIVNYGNSLYQAIEIDKNYRGTYTLSAFFHKHGHSEPTNPSFGLELSYHDGYGLRPIGGKDRLTQNALTSSTGIRRYSETINMADYASTLDRTTGNVYLVISVKGTDSNWVVVDGVQLVKGPHPVHYMPEEGLFNMMNGVKGSHSNRLETRDLSVSENAYFGAGLTSLGHTDIKNLTVNNDLSVNGITRLGYTEISELNTDFIYGTLELEDQLAAAGIENHGKTKLRNHTGLKLSNIHDTPNNINIWNNPDRATLLLENSNNAMSFTVGGTINDRNAMIQVGHNSASYPNHHGNLWLNPLGGDVTIGGNEVVARGSNSDGHWVRYYDGTQIVWAKQNAYYSATNSWGPLYRSTAIRYTLPQGFVGDAVFSVAAERTAPDDAFRMVGMGHKPYSSSTPNFYTIYGSSTSSTGFILHYIGIGRWK